MRPCALVLFLVLGACGGSDAPAPAASAATSPTEPAAAAGGEHGPQGQHGKHGHGHGGATVPEIDAFHDVLAPLWHGEPGPQRAKDTCAAVGGFKTRAAAVKAAGTPSGASAEAWSAAGADLEKSVADLEAVCRQGDSAGAQKPDADFDAAFTRVHEAFHRAMEVGGGGHHH